MSLTDAALLLGCVAAVTGAFGRNVTAVALLASTAFSEILCHLQIQFHLVLWLSIDFGVIFTILLTAIHHQSVRGRDLAILLCFGPVFLLYFVQPVWWVDAIKLIVAGQMFLTFPAARIWAAATEWIARLKGDDQLRMAMA